MKNEFDDLRILFINEIDVFKVGNSESTTILSMFGEEVVKNSLSMQILDKHHIKITENGNVSELHPRRGGTINSIVKKYNPDVIYTMSSSLRFLITVLKIKIQCKVPVLMHYYDNWRECGRQKLKNIILYFLEDKKHGALVISDDMKEAYEKKYKRPYHTYMALNQFEKKEAIGYFSDGKRHVIYAGGLHLERYKMLLKIQEELRKRKNFVLDIFTLDSYINKYDSMFDSTITSFHPSVERATLIRIYQEADVLLHVENVNQENSEFIRYSMTTKIPEYLSSNKPVVCFSKQGTASYNFLKKYNAALFAENEQELSDVFEKIEKYSNEVSQTVNNGSIAYAEHFDIEKKRKELSELIKSICVGKCR